MHRSNCVLMSVLLMITDGLIVKGPSGPLVARLGSSVVLPCSVDQLLSVEGLKVEWRRTDSDTLVHLFQDERLRVSGSSRSISASVGEDVTLSCSVDSHITPEDFEEVSWKKTDEDEDIVVLLYQNNEASPEASDERYRDRVEFFTDEIPKGNFSLRLKSVRTEDKGVYVCEVFAGGLSANITVELERLGFSVLHIMVLILCISACGSALLLCCLIYCRSSTKEILMSGKVISLGGSVDLPCQVKKSLLENNLKVEWRRAETLVHLYEDGKSQADKQHEDYHKRAHFLKKKIKDGNFSLRLKKLRDEDEGIYRCKVYRGQNCVRSANEELKLESTSNLILIRQKCSFT
ncbi:butyrophilin 2 [Labeo rohita]|uniref:Butyrophilin 2 n=1 Tax=Labeo rohita TaxID=84645 RepID=A0A498P257_LABRO|nr:butyrophilin 2 [Labeo rohita]